MQIHSPRQIGVAGLMVLLVGVVGTYTKQFLELPWGMAAVSGRSSVENANVLFYSIPELLTLVGAGAILVSLVLVAGDFVD